MTAHLVQIPEALDRFVDEQVKSGQFTSVSELVTASLKLMAEELADDEARERRFWDRVQVGVDQIDRGEYEEVTNVKSWLDGLGRR
jgi:putative addiction module CopG family antidote